MKNCHSKAQCVASPFCASIPRAIPKYATAGVLYKNVGPSYYATGLGSHTATMAPAASQRPRVIAPAGVINVRVVRANYFCWFSGPLFADVSYNIIRPMLYGRAGVPCKVILLLERSFIGGLLMISTLFMRMCRRHSLKKKFSPYHLFWVYLTKKET